MLSTVKKNIILKAIRIRMVNGEALEDILNSYPKLTEEDKLNISKEIGE